MTMPIATRDAAISAAEAMQALSAALKGDPDYAWIWHCSIAIVMQDEGVPHEAANRAAANFMKLAFGVDTP